MEGTIASLRGYVENRGGKVILTSVMIAHEGALQLPIKQGILEAINNKHGSQINEFWKETFGYGIEKLTQGEAGDLRAAKTFDEIRNRITTARHEGIIQLNEKREGKEKNLSQDEQKNKFSKEELIQTLLNRKSALSLTDAQIEKLTKLIKEHNNDKQKSNDIGPER